MGQTYFETGELDSLQLPWGHGEWGSILHLTITAAMRTMNSLKENDCWDIATYLAT